MRIIEQIGAIFCLGVLTAAAGCGSNDSGVVTAVPVTPAQAANIATVNAAANETMYAAAATDPFLFAAALSTTALTATSTAQAATNAANNFGKFYGPVGCGMATANGETVTYVLNNCTGPISDARLSGTVSVTFTAQAATANSPVSFQVRATSTNLKVGDLTVNVNRQGLLTQNGANRVLQITNDTSTATGPAGNVSVRQSQGTLSWTLGSNCTTHSGVDTISSGDTALTATYTNVTRCAGQCPQSGTVAVTNPQGSGVTLNYNASASVPYTSTGGGSGTIAISCGGQ